MATAGQGSTWRRLVWVVPLAAAVYASVQVAAEPFVNQAIDRFAQGYAEGLRQEEEAFADYAISPIFQPPQDFSVEMDRWPRWGWRGLEALLFAAGLGALACGITGGLLRRWMLLTGFFVLVHAVNTAIESRVFIGATGQAHLVLGTFVPALLCCLVLALGLWPATNRPNGLKGASSGGTVTGRLVAAWAAFIVAYVAGGLILASQMPQLREVYNDPGNPMRIPPPEVVLGTQAVRSFFYLIPTMAVIERWGLGRVSLFISLFLAHWTLVGLAPLATPNELMPDELRLGHALEIGFDSFLYAGLVVLLLAQRRWLTEVQSEGLPARRPI